MAITKLNSLAIPPDTIVESDLSYPLTNFSSTGIDDNATSTAITIDSSENVGIGGSPSCPLHVKKDNYLKVIVQDASGTHTPFSIGSGNNGVTISNNASADTADEAITLNQISQSAIFFTAGAERMRLDSSGNLLVGTTGSSDSARIEVVKTGANVMTIRRTETGANGLVVFRTGGGVAGTIAATSSTTLNYNTSSDKRLKENIVDAPAGNIDAIRVRSFDWKADGSHQTYGMVAQELVEVAPEAVSQGDTEDDMWGVDYSKLVPMMIKEIQDLKAEVAALKGGN